MPQTIICYAVASSLSGDCRLSRVWFLAPLCCWPKQAYKAIICIPKSANKEPKLQAGTQDTGYSTRTLAPNDGTNSTNRIITRKKN